MRKIFKSIISSVMVCVALVPLASCGYKTSEWLAQKICEHDFDEEEILKEPTCGEIGKKMRICSKCELTEISTIKATGEHIFDESVPLDDGVKYTCSVCGKTKVASYTETQAMVGDKVVGNWFRIYANSNPVPGNNVYASTYIKVGSYGLEFGYGPNINQQTFIISIGSSNAQANCDAVLQTRTGENERGRYVDISFTEGTFTYMHFTEEKTGEITSETTISEVSDGAIYRLEIK